MRSTDKINNRTIYYSFWGLLVLVQFLFLSNFKSINEALSRGLVNTILILLIFYFTKFLTNNYYDKNNLKSYLLYQSIFVIIISLLRRTIEITFFDRFVLIDQQAATNAIPLNTIGILFNFFATAIISIFSSLYFIEERKKALEIKHNNLKLENLENKMEMLNNQLSAHFLFNSLNDIYASAVLKNGETPEMVLKLSDIMKFITYDATLNEILFLTELKQAKNYISFFKLKSKNKSIIQIKEDISDPNFRTMPMLLIPLIENALKHGNLNDSDIEPFFVQ